MATESYDTGDVVNNHVLIGEEWVQVNVTEHSESAEYSVGDVVNQHVWTGSAWVPTRKRKPPKKPSLQKRWENKVDEWVELNKEKVAEMERKEPLFDQCGRKVAEGVVAGRRVKIYERGFVQVGMFKLGAPERLLGITAQDNSQQKTALGRSLAAGVTLGANLMLSPSKRGSLYLIIVTDVKTHTLTLSPPTDSDLKAMHKLEAAGRAVLATVEAQNAATQNEIAPTSSTVESSLADQLAQLSQLHQSGALTDEEFATAKTRLLSAK